MPLKYRLPAASPRLWHLGAALAAGAVVLVAAVFATPMLTAWLALAIAVPSLAIALLALSKAKTLEFCPEVLGGDVILPRAARPEERPKLLLPLQFNNSGYADGIVEWIAVRFTLDDRTERSQLLSPVAEVDMQRFIQAKRRLEDDHTVEPFTSFTLDGRRAAAKFVLFDMAEWRRGAAPLELRPGRYRFEVFLKASNRSQPHLALSFEHTLEPKQVEDYRNGSTVYLINYQVTLPSTRRALAGAEWLPRAAPN